MDTILSLQRLSLASKRILKKSMKILDILSGMDVLVYREKPKLWEGA